MRYILSLTIIFVLAGIAYASERISDNCYKYDGVLVCEAQKITELNVIVKVESPKVEPQKQEESPIVRVIWEYGDETASVKSEPHYTDKQICDAIWYVEGQEKANQYYGINPKYVRCDGKEACKNVCLKTVAKWRRVYNEREYIHFKDFETFLSYKYCPPNHVIWLKNLRFWLKKLAI